MDGVKKHYTESQNRATQKYLAKHKEQLRLWITKGVKAKLIQLAEEQGISLTRYVANAINAYAGYNVMRTQTVYVDIVKSFNTACVPVVDPEETEDGEGSREET